MSIYTAKSPQEFFRELSKAPNTSPETAKAIMNARFPAQSIMLYLSHPEIAESDWVASKAVRAVSVILVAKQFALLADGSIQDPDGSLHARLQTTFSTATKRAQRESDNIYDWISGGYTSALRAFVQCYDKFVDPDFKAGLKLIKSLVKRHREIMVDGLGLSGELARLCEHEKWLPYQKILRAIIKDSGSIMDEMHLDALDGDLDFFANTLDKLLLAKDGYHLQFTDFAQNGWLYLDRIEPSRRDLTFEKLTAFFESAPSKRVRSRTWLPAPNRELMATWVEILYAQRNKVSHEVFDNLMAACFTYFDTDQQWGAKDRLVFIRSFPDLWRGSPFRNADAPSKALVSLIRSVSIEYVPEFLSALPAKEAGDEDHDFHSLIVSAWSAAAIDRFRCTSPYFESADIDVNNTIHLMKNFIGNPFGETGRVFFSRYHKELDSVVNLICAYAVMTKSAWMDRAFSPTGHDSGHTTFKSRMEADPPPQDQMETINKLKNILPDRDITLPLLLCGPEVADKLSLIFTVGLPAQGLNAVFQCLEKMSLDEQLSAVTNGTRLSEVEMAP